MPASTWRITCVVLACVLLEGCHGYITSREPLISVANASYPLPASAGIDAFTLDDNHVWQRTEGRAHLSLVQGNYRVTDPDRTEPSAETYLFKRIDNDRFIVQATSPQTDGSDRAYGLIVHADMYYLFTFDSGEQTCANLSDAERSRFNAVLKDDACYVANLSDLGGLLLFLREKFPYPTSAFVAG